MNRDLGVMVDAMRHEPRYTSGRYSDEALGIAVGWVSHPDSFADCMPLVSHNQETVLIFHGENFSSSLPPHGQARNAASLLDLYAKFGSQFYAQLNGWFSGVILDRQTNRITIFNDRYGMGRIYFHETDDEFLFASEAKSLLKVRPELRSIEPQMLAEFLRYNCVLGNKTLFSRVSLLPQASAWSFAKAPRPTKHQYFTFTEWEQQSRLPEKEFYQQWAETVSTVFPPYSQGENSVALSLSAGLDTRLIMAALGKQNKLHGAYSFGGAWGELLDVSIARKAAGVYHEPFEVIRVNDQFLKGFSDYATRAVYISDGTHDAFGAHDVFLNEIAHTIAPVRLTGKFGSEVVRVRKLIPSLTYPPSLLQPEIDRTVNRLPTYAQTNPQGHSLTRVISEEISWHEYGRVAVEQSQLTLRSPYLDNDLVRLMYQAPIDCRAAGALQERYVKEKAPELARLITNMGRFSSNIPLVTDLAYYPFWALFKMEYVYLHATPHWVTRLDRMLERWRLERLFAGRQKWEAYRIWIKTHFSEFIKEQLLNSRADYTRYFDYGLVSRMATRHIAGTHNYLNEINKALTLQLICSSLLRA
jgi:asparagine synthase (glutamine-hydrolysing)